MIVGVEEPTELFTPRQWELCYMSLDTPSISLIHPRVGEIIVIAHNELLSKCPLPLHITFLGLCGSYRHFVS